MFQSDVGINGSGAQGLMTQQLLDDLNIDAGLQQMSGEAVAQGLLILLMICTQQRFAIGVIPSVA